MLQHPLISLIGSWRSVGHKREREKEKAAGNEATFNTGRSADLCKAHVLHTIAFYGVRCCRLIESLLERSSVRQDSLFVGIRRAHQLLQKQAIS